MDIRRFGLRLQVGFQLFLTLLAAGIGFGLIVMVHDAITSRSVVIDPFEVPASLAADGLNGKVVAAGFLDVLTRIQDANHKSVLARDLSNTWANEISIGVPETGVSIGQLERLIKTRFGHDQHIEGDLVRIPAGAGADGTRHGDVAEDLKRRSGRAGSVVDAGRGVRLQPVATRIVGGVPQQ